MLVRRTVILGAPPDRVWPFLATAEGWATWWGPGSTIDARPGGAMRIRYPNGQTAEGQVLTVEPPVRLELTWGYDRADAPIPVGGSVVTILLEPEDGGTRLTLDHRVADEATGDQHRPGWRYQLGLFRSLIGSTVVAPTVHATIDAWHAAWSTDDADRRRALLATATTIDVECEEPVAVTVGRDDLDELVTQSRRALPATVSRQGPALVSGTLVTWAWQLTAGDRSVDGRSVASVDPAGGFRRVTSFWTTEVPGFPLSVVPDG